jgi:uncharacterized membrane protein YfcA
MKQSTATDALCITVFIFGVLVGTFMHGHISWHDIIAALTAGSIFGIIRMTKFKLLIRKVLRKFSKTH